jgi:hypothetical protein
VSQTERLEQFALHDDAARTYGVAQGTILIDPATGVAYDARDLWAWSPSLLQYVKLTVDGSGNLNVVGAGGGGGAVTIADGANVVEGATTDAAVLGDTTGTISAKLRGLNKNIASTVGLGLPIFDYCAQSQTATQDVWTFKTGGSGGTLVATVTINYTDAGKGTITNVAKT